MQDKKSFFSKILDFVEKYKILIVFVSFVAIILVYSFVNPYKEKFLPKCSFHSITGYKCPGCGSQRAIYNLLHFEFKSALKENMLLVLFIPYIFFGLWIELFSKKFTTSKKIYKILYGLPAMWTIFLTILFYWVFRNLKIYDKILVLLFN